MKNLVVTVLLIFTCGCSTISPNFQQVTNDQDCFQAYSGNMTPNQLAAAMNLPMVTLSNLPQAVNNSPFVFPDIIYENERKSCGISVFYASSEDQMTWEIQIRVHKYLSDTLQPQSIHNCVSYTDTDFPFQSSCIGVISNVDDQFKFIILTRYSEERTREMAAQLFLE